MPATSPATQAALDTARKSQAELDKRVFLLKTLLETSRELNRLIQPKKIMDTFLLTTMGFFGATQGLVLLIESAARQGHLVRRNIPEAVARDLEQSIPQLYDRYFLSENFAGPAGPRMRIVDQDSFLAHSPFPSSTQVLVLWTINEKYCGLLALGGRLSEERFGEDDFEVLSNLTNILIGALLRALFTRSIEQLNTDLRHKNTMLQATLDRAEETRRDLDRRVFHLKTLYDLSLELSGITEPSRLLETFLLVVMGALGVGRGFCLLHDRKSKNVMTASRGMEKGPTLTSEEAEKLFYRCFDGAEKRSLTPMSVSRLSSPERFFRDPEFDLDVRSAIMLVVDGSLMGLVGLGPNLADAPLATEEEELLCAMASHFMAFLENARSFETIRGLNRDLSQSNEELRRTISDLTEARQKITVLERAKAHLKTILQREAERIGRSSPLDYVLILVTACLLAVLFNYSNPHGISILPEVLFRPPAAEVGVAEARELLQGGGAVLVDARPQELYGHKHIEGAINVPASLFDLVYKMKLARMLDSERTVIVYGRNISKRYDEEVAYQLGRRDHERVKVLSGGLDAWEAMGYPVKR